MKWQYTILIPLSIIACNLHDTNHEDVEALKKSRDSLQAIADEQKLRMQQEKSVEPVKSLEFFAFTIIYYNIVFYENIPSKVIRESGYNSITGQFEKELVMPGRVEERKTPFVSYGNVVQITDASEDSKYKLLDYMENLLRQENFRSKIEVTKREVKIFFNYASASKFLEGLKTN